MRSNNYFVVAAPLSLLNLFACGSSSSSSGNTSSCTNAAGPNAIPTSNSSSIPLYIADPSTTGSYGYTNEPLVSVTICTPNHTSSSQCQVVSNILLDTGSSGLRIFNSAIGSNVVLNQLMISTPVGTKSLAECATFGTGADWGSVKTGDLIFGGQTASNIPIHVIDINYASIPSGCSEESPDTDPCSAGYNGILGVAPLIADCGANCASTDDTVNPGSYFGCDSTGCYNASHGNCGTDHTCVFTVSTGAQVSNPVTSFSSPFNNGVSISLPNIGASGASGVTGTLTLGIQAATAPSGVFAIDPNGATDNNYLDFNTTFNGIVYGYQSTNNTTAFLDSGSNGIFYPGNLTVCSDASSFYCPASTQNLNATMSGYQGSPSSSVSFSVANTDALGNTGNSAFSNLGGPSNSSFDWGLPFFFNRTVYIGIDGTSATINSSSATGPYWAF